MKKAALQGRAAFFVGTVARRVLVGLVEAVAVNLLALTAVDVLW